MNKYSLFDDVARTLASPIPRRRACAQILGGLAVAALASLGGPGAALAGGKRCKSNEKKCVHNCCKPGDDCCYGQCCDHKNGYYCDTKKCKCTKSQTNYKK